MRDLTIHEVIKAIPLREEFRQELLTGFDTYDEDKKAEINRICSRAFNQMKVALRAYWEERIGREVSTGERQLDKDLVLAVEEAMWQDIEDRISGKKQDEEKLEDVREQLQKLIGNN